MSCFGQLGHYTETSVCPAANFEHTPVHIEEELVQDGETSTLEPERGDKPSPLITQARTQVYLLLSRKF